jgi:hypothetical protein
MPTDETPRQPQAMPIDAGAQPGHWWTDSASPEQVFAGENGDPIWEPQPFPAPGRNERLRRAVREPEGKLPPGRLIDLVQPRPAPPPPPANG